MEEILAPPKWNTFEKFIRQLSDILYDSGRLSPIERSRVNDASLKIRNYLWTRYNENERQAAYELALRMSQTPLDFDSAALLLDRYAREFSNYQPLLTNNNNALGSSEDSKAVDFLGTTPAIHTPISPINAVSIRDSSFGQYLESINTTGTWFEKVQTILGFEPKPITALDVLYTSSGILGVSMLIPIGTSSGPVSMPLLAVGSTLVVISAIGLSEEERRTTILSGISAGAFVIWEPGVAGFILREAYFATKETAKQTVELAKSAIGLTTTFLGFATAAVGGSAILLIPQKKKKSQPRRSRKRKRSR